MVDTLRIERRNRKPGLPNGLVAVVWLGKLQAGVVGYYDFEGNGNDCYVPACFLPDVKGGINQGESPHDFGSLNEALEWVIRRVNAWLEKAGLEATKGQLDQAYLANVQPLDGQTRDEWLRLASWAETLNAHRQNNSPEIVEFARLAVKLVPEMARRAIDCGFS